MESHISSNPIQELAACSEDGRNISPSRKHHKTKEKGKKSTVSLRDSDKTKKRTSKRQPLLSQTVQEIPKARESVTTCNLESVDGDHLSTLEGLQAEHEDKNRNTALNLMQMTLDDRDTTRSRQINEQTEDGIDSANEAAAKEEPTSSNEIPQRNVNLEQKLARDDEFGINGVMDLSALNVTDSDMPLIIQQAFRREKKKCTRLILNENALTSDGMKILVDELLTVPTSLKNLSFSSNPGIGDAGIEHLARLLQTSRSVTLLALHHTGITDRGVRLLADALCGIDANLAPALEKLYISFNKSITDESLEALVQILEQNQTLKVFSLQHCSLSDRARRRLRQVATKKKKKKFSLSD